MTATVDPPAIRALKAATLCSGAAALIAETVWTRAFSIVVGSTVEAASATFAAFLVGLAAGAYLFGRFADRLRHPMRVYAVTELGIALLAGTTGGLLYRFRDALVVGGSGGTLARAATAFGTVLAAVLLPTLLMGATFPLMIAAARQAGAKVGAISRLYALNVLGASLGTVGCGFVLLRQVGVRSSILAGVLLNVAAALSCLPALGASAGVTPPAPKPSARVPHPVLLLVGTASGALVLGAEIAWTELASFFLGNRTYAFSALLACVLVLLAAGSWLSERLLDRLGQRLPELLGAMVAAGALFTLLSGAAGAWWVQRQPELEKGWPAIHQLVLLYRVAETLLLLAPMVVTLGCLFPLALTGSHRTEERSGESAGVFYLFNTMGSVAGSLLVGFWAIERVGVYGCIAGLVAAGCLVAAVVFAAARGASPRARLYGVGASVAILALVPALLPAQLTLVSPNEELVYRREDAHGVFQVLRSGRLLKVTNNRTQLIHYLGAFSTSFVQQMQGHLGMFFNPGAKTAAVLGSGYGITAGAMGLYPQLERVDAVEILPAMVDAADLFQPFNLGYHRNARIRVLVDDGRHFLARAPDLYDVVSINVSDPRLPGGSALFHADFYEVVKRHLRPGGVVVQHAFGTETALVLTTLQRSFKHLALFPAYQNGYNVVAADHPLEVDAAAVEKITAEPAVQAQLRAIGMFPPVTAARLAQSALHPEDLPELFSAPEIATDDHPLLEFSARGAAGMLFSNE
ncbi:MAG TPA: fused MFS/spermidine synthase [Myxococcales bacterium]|nr:fused MFS/spermidine synthase [Myxococcales bacterium]